jgi:ribosome biogenesis GTPase A
MCFIEALNKKSFAPLTDHLKKTEGDVSFCARSARDGGGHSERRQVHVYQCRRRQKRRRNPGQAGVTRANKWIKCRDFFLLDTPGVLPPKFTQEADAIALAAIGCVKETVFSVEDLSLEILAFMSAYYPERLSGATVWKARRIRRLRCLKRLPQSAALSLRAARRIMSAVPRSVLKEFKNGTLGPISIDRPEEADG